MQLAKLYSSIGNCYSLKNENVVSEQYFNKSLTLYGKCSASVKDENLLNDIQWNMGVVLFRKREFNSALEYYKGSLMLMQRIAPHERIKIAELNDGIGACYQALKKKRFFPKPKKDLPADTREDPFLVSEKEGFVSNLLLINGKNGSVQKVRYETFLKFFNKGSVQKVRHETFIEQFQKGSA